MDLDAGALVLDFGAEFAQFHALDYGDPRRARGCGRCRSLLAARAELGQQTQDIELPPAVTRELQLSTLGMEPAEAGVARGQIDGAVGEAQLGQLERRLRAARQCQIGERKRRVGDRQFEVRAGLFGGQLQAQLHSIRAQLGRRGDGFVDRADRYLIEDHLLDV